MNCARVEKLLPLYVEGDLDGPEMERLRSHLSSCDLCRNLSEEFAASQERLRNFAVPEFDAEFYEQIRSTVLTEISSSQLAQPSIFQTLRRTLFFPARPALAASLATLALFGALSLALYLSLAKSEATLPLIEQSMANLNSIELTEDALRPTSDEVVSDSAGIQQPGSTVINTVPRRRSVRVTPKVVRPESSAPQEIDNSNPVVAQAATTQPPGAAGDEASREAVARMEIQTSDPNIRIIWLARKPGE